MKLIEKLAKQFSSDLYKEMYKMSPEIAGKPDPLMDHCMERVFTLGFLAARELACDVYEKNITECGECGWDTTDGSTFTRFEELGEEEVE